MELEITISIKGILSERMKKIYEKIESKKENDFERQLQDGLADSMAEYLNGVFETSLMEIGVKNKMLENGEMPNWVETIEEMSDEDKYIESVDTPLQ